MNGVTITTSRDYIVIKIPKKQIAKSKGSSWEKGLVGDKILKLLEKGKQEFKEGKLKPVQSLSELI